MLSRSVGMLLPVSARTKEEDMLTHCDSMAPEQTGVIGGL